MSAKCQELEGIKTPSFPKTTIPYGIMENGDIVCAVFGFNEKKSEFFIEVPVICTDYIKTYLPPNYKSNISPLNPQEAKRKEKAMRGLTEEILLLVGNGQIDKALELIQFHKLKF
ncbi:MAG: hypothetical protein Q8K02_00390 [Flavobacterium sp.]|nr:hypothetical protein [Flavobacterium sp.]